MTKPLLKLALLGTLPVFISSCAADQIYTMKDDCHFVRTQAKENLDVLTMLNKVEKEDSKHRRFMICTPPDTATAIFNRISDCQIDLAACQNSK